MLNVIGVEDSPEEYSFTGIETSPKDTVADAIARALINGEFNIGIGVKRGKGRDRYSGEYRAKKTAPVAYFGISAWNGSSPGYRLKRPLPAASVVNMAAATRALLMASVDVAAAFR
jgi:hypothetical protein